MFSVLYLFPGLPINQFFAQRLSELFFFISVTLVSLYHSPLWYFCRRCAGSDGLIKDLAEGAAVPAGTRSVDAHVEVLAVARVGVAWVSHSDVMGHRGALEGGVTCAGRKTVVY